ncbi:hypothetical protein CLV49_1464 [Labedella gwakjiensis]|uniref:Uncharacterized protein n=1 Tax=Labedella gwakjiensis TaxID=390269 RepID=A0A2P8GV61_9MICO|nr:hypothetical protein [Labedella gwakjiensis]PSL37857.1 hypothetical protein CLV49_1464 [Labedella gwakjiensis]RUQ87572.1 hypothetical protein ELQ93_11880 [Labedella gwakjiensis]
MSFGVIPLATLVCALVVSVVVIARWRRDDAFRRIVVPAALLDGVATARRFFVGRLAIATAAAGLVGAAAFAVNEGLPSALGRVALLAPGLASLTALVLVAAFPAVSIREPGTSRSADLDRRRPWSYAPRWAVGLPVAAGSLVLGAVIAFGLTSSTQEDGQYRAFTVVNGDYTSTSSPYPGWFYGVPIAAMVIAIAVVAVVALTRIAGAPRPTDSGLREIDAVMRMLATRVVVKLTTGTFLLYLGVILAVGGNAMSSASGQWTGEAYARIEPWTTLSLVSILVGLVTVAFGLCFVLLAVLDVARAPSATRPASLPRPVGAV